MRRLLAIMICCLAAPAAPHTAAADPVVVELFTSQGCSACPPADALLEDLSEDDHILPLAFHVDYWDYLGWKDSFGSSQATDRQKAYARAGGRMMVYTPQMIVGGHYVVAGHKPAKVLSAIMAVEERTHTVSITATHEGPIARIRLRSAAPLGVPVKVLLVRFIPRATVDVANGENAGRSLDYTNIVTDWTTIATWDGAEPLEVEAELNPPLSSAVLVQAPGPGRIVAATRLD